MRSQTILTILLVLFTATELMAKRSTSFAASDASSLRSAYLGPDAWAQSNLSHSEIVQQLRSHFDAVQQILIEQTEASLNEATDRLEDIYGPFSANRKRIVRDRLSKQRRLQLQTLLQYAQRGVFPVNKCVSKTPAPIFVDQFGTHCAVGYLMHRSGSDAIVDQIVRSNNLVYINEIESGVPMEWILNSGLTQSEAALIQPSYTPPAFDATLVDFDTDGFMVSDSGLTVSDLTVQRHSFQNPGGLNTDELFEFGVDLVEVIGDDLAMPDEFGIAVDSGTYFPPGMKAKYAMYEPNFDNWVFTGGNFGSFGPDAGDDAAIYKIQYTVSAGEFHIPTMTIASSGNFSGNFVPNEGAIRITTFAETSGVLGEGTIQADLDDFILIDSEFISAGPQEFTVVNFVLEYRPLGDYGFGGFTSLWNEFELALIGDINCDGAIDLLDVGPFVYSLSNDFPDFKADINQDGSDDLLDVAGFVDLLTGG